MSPVCRGWGSCRKTVFESWLPNCLDFLEIYYAGARLELLVNPINIRLLGSEMAFILNDAENSRLVVAHGDTASEVVRALEAAPAVEGVIWLSDSAIPVPGRKVWTYERFLYRSGGSSASSSAGCRRPTGPSVLHIRHHRPAQRRHFDPSQRHDTRPGGHCRIQHFRRRHLVHVPPMSTWRMRRPALHWTWVGGRHVMVSEFEPGNVLKLHRKRTHHPDQSDPDHAQPDGQSSAGQEPRLCLLEGYSVWRRTDRA